MTTIVVSEGQARELAKVEPAKRVEVLEKAVEAGPVTAKTIQEAAAIVAPIVSLTERCNVQPRSPATPGQRFHPSERPNTRRDKSKSFLGRPAKK